jgi:threonine/homoserine efflux transporter RhtA
MFVWAIVIFIGLWLLFADMKPVSRAKLLGNPWAIHAIVIGSGLWIHGGSAEGAMAAVASGCFSALYVRFSRKIHGYIKGGTWYPGTFRRVDPRSTT